MLFTTMGLGEITQPMSVDEEVLDLSDEYLEVGEHEEKPAKGTGEE